jgi:putative DNA methylase
VELLPYEHASLGVHNEALGCQGVEVSFQGATRTDGAWRGRYMTKQKLIEVALPLEAINRESAREKSIRHGHPSTLHLWWARRPLAACRAVLFAQLVDDPSSNPDRFPTEEAQNTERRRLHDIIERLVPWEATTDQGVLEEARAEIRASCGGMPPPVLDPFCGGGSIPLEAQRLGLEVRASDLNPVSVLITRALVDIPPRWSGRPPVHPVSGRLDAQSWVGAQGLAEDVRHYGRWIRDEAETRIGQLYPQATLPDGSNATVIAWIWARSVVCPNPACGAKMTLASTFSLGSKKGRERWVVPVVDGKRVRFEVGGPIGSPPAPAKVGRGAKFRCLVCGETAPEEHIKEEGVAGRMDAQLMAIVAEGQRKRIYLPADPKHEIAAQVERPSDVPDTELAGDKRAIWCPLYGLSRHADLFTNRQLIALTTFADLVEEARHVIASDAHARGMPEPDAAAYADSVSTYLALGVSRLTDSLNSLVSWSSSRDQARNLFARQGIPMIWDFAEINPFAGAAGDLETSTSSIARAIDSLPAKGLACVDQADATAESTNSAVVATDPPYYDNIGYADLSDFFYVWLRRMLRRSMPDLFGTVLTPKAEELVATPYRFGGSKAKAKSFFEQGFVKAFKRIQSEQLEGFPVTVFYAFKQSEEDGGDGLASTGWETLLEGLLQSGLAITATWPMRTEREVRSVGIGTNALASSIVLACRPRADTAGVTDRRSFIAALRAELALSIRHLQQSSIAPVDLAQAAIGPGMAIFSRYAKVVEPSGDPMRVRAALGFINQVLAEILDEQEGDFDPDTRWAMKWFEQYGMDEGSSGVAEQLCTTYNVSLRGLIEGGIVNAVRGKTSLMSREDLPGDWAPPRSCSASTSSIWMTHSSTCRSADTRLSVRSSHSSNGR